ncbi:hypothetical protein LGW20_09205 [Streptococcus mutans]|uniref:hypothetical protein n=1 Tax=Streptococcus mutans TaxID=1309 RepID=UPI0002D5A26D|nr:hypothetical protein [Streptococcus mutans]MCB4945923.1 hypothetical protein [Streptococcus mutans]MCB4958952.1 hypothetical protein [Streptococcus mutans]MCB4968508.1 hypothetical protein [Streptococcus mutans]MCB5026296.1 hypothetical protein [Streptococcus mutans]MCB5032867.1 hypothetical protein [Streptococcus mutans]
MQKTYFQRTYSLTLFLVVFVIISFGVSFASKFFSELLQANQTDVARDLFELVIEKVLLVSEYTYKVGVVLSLILIVIVGIELYKRIVNDSVLNYPKSIYQTIRLRIFLKQDLNYEAIMTIENQTINHQNPVMIQFNKAVRWSVVDVQKGEVNALLKVPRTQQAQKLLRTMEDDTREEISNRNPEYYFSTPSRDGNELWFVGTKR